MNAIQVRIAILKEVEAERIRQISKGMSLSGDNMKMPDDWHQVISDYAGWARCMGRMGSHDKARRRLVQVAALAVAAVEALDRQQPEGQ